MRAYFPSFGQLQSELNRLHNDVNRVFGRAASRSDVSPSSCPAINVWDDENKFYVEAELPGVNPDALDISIREGNRLTLKGERNRPEVEQANWHRCERGFGSFSRELALPVKVNAQSVDATYNSGVLRIELSKADEEKPRRIQVKEIVQ